MSPTATTTLSLTADGRVFSHSPAAPDRLGVPADALVGTPLREVLSPADLPSPLTPNAPPLPPPAPSPSTPESPEPESPEPEPLELDDPPEPSPDRFPAMLLNERGADARMRARVVASGRLVHLTAEPQYAGDDLAGYVVWVHPLPLSDDTDEPDSDALSTAPAAGPRGDGAARDNASPIPSPPHRPPSPGFIPTTDTVRRMKLMASLMETLAAGLHTEGTANEMIDRLGTHFGASMCSVLAFTDGRSLEPLTTARSPIWDALPESTLTACLSSLMDGQTIAVTAPHRRPAPDVEVIVEHDGLDDDLLVAAPLPADNGPVGVLLIDDPDPDQLCGLTIHLLRTAASAFSAYLTHRQQADETQALRARHQRLFEDGNDIVFELTDDGVFRYVSPAVVHATGYYPAELIGQRIDRFLLDEDRDTVPRFWMENGDTRHELRIRDRHGETRYLRVSLRVEELSDGTCVISGSASDVTRQRIAELELESERAFVDHAINHLPGLFCLLNHNLRITRWNEQLQTALGVDAPQVPACRFTEVFDFRSRPEVNDHIRQAFLGKTIRFEGRVRIDGDLIPYMFTATPVEIEGDRCVVCIGIDIRELDDAQRRLSENFEALRQMHSISVEDDMPTDRKVRHLLQSGREYLNADMAILARASGRDLVVEHGIGPLAPEEGRVAPIEDTVCRRVLTSPPYEWPLHITIEDPSSTPFPEVQGVDGPLHYTGIPLRIDGQRWGMVSFCGTSQGFRRKTRQSDEYMKLLGQWIESQLAREKAQEAVRKNERRFRDLFAAAPDAYAVLDPHTGRVTDCNTAMEDLLGRPRDRIIGFHYSTLHALPTDATNPEELDSVRWLSHVVEGGQWRGDNVPMRSGDRAQAPVLVDISARHVDIGDRPSVLAVFRDVTQRKEAEDALLQAVSRNEVFNRELQTLIRVSRGLETHLDSGVVAGRVVAGTLDTIPSATSTSLWTIDGDTAQLVASDHETVGCRLHVNRSDDVGAPLLGSGPAVQIPLSRGPFTDVYEALALPCITHLTMTRHRHPELHDPFFDGVKSLIAVPIATSETVIGMLIATSDVATAAFQDRHHALLQSIGAQAAVSLNNAQAVEELRTMSQQLLQAQEDERQRVAQELHDETGGLLTALQFKLQEVDMALSVDDAGGDGSPDAATADESPIHAATALLDDVRDLTETLADVLRRVSRSLRPRILDDIGLSAALPWLVDEFTDRSDIKVSFSSEISPGTRFDPLLETAAFRITQEALTNVARYADTDAAQVIVNRNDDALRLHIIDDGGGFDMDEWQRRDTPTLGLLGMTERAERLGGNLTISSDPGEGTRISATLPVKPDG
jgi:PAS domain S-box-containing protein